MSLLRVRNLKVYYPVKSHRFGQPDGELRAVDGVDLDVGAGEAVGLVGESGCGKTTMGRAILRLVEPTGGTVHLKDQEITGLSQGQMRPWRRRMQMIFQDPHSSLNPRMTVGQTLGEALAIHKLASGGRERRERIEALLDQVGLSRGHRERYPHEFSGGQRQRIGIARALAVEPDLIIADEPVSALDVSVQAQVINLLRDLQQQRGLAYLFISHDLAVVEHLCQRIVVMYLGRVVESADARTLCRQPLHPYTKALLSAVPVVDPKARRKRIVLSGDVPSPLNPPAGCPFHTRCPVAEPRCRTEVPVLREIASGHHVACHLVSDAVPETAVNAT